MKKIPLIIVLCVYCTFSGMAQLEVDANGNTSVSKNIYLLGNASNFLGTTGNVPITFKVNGVLAGFTGSSNNYNVSFGYGSISTSAGWGNTAIGLEALRNNKYDGNTAIGWSALYSNVYGELNTATGVMALCNNTGGSYNTANSAHVLSANTTGTGNTASGAYALCSNMTGSNNTAIGFLSNTNGNLSNAIAIGYNAVATASNAVVLGTYTVTSAGGAVTWSTVSDGRAKKNIRSEVPGLAFINRLQPVMYNFDLNAMDELQKSDDPKINAFRDSLRNARSFEAKEMEAKARANKEKIVYSGFIAQDVEKAARSIGYNFSGVDAPENGKGAYGLRYAEFVVPLVKAVQELSEQNAQLQEQINELKANSSLRSFTDETESPKSIDPIIAQCKLYQNAPNPFSQNTQIKFYVSESVKKALLCIYDLQGNQIKQILITERGEGSQIISGSELSAGMYLYALIVDGKEVDVKRMILTK